MFKAKWYEGELGDKQKSMDRQLAREISNPGRVYSSNKYFFQPILCSSLGRTHNKCFLASSRNTWGEELGKATHFLQVKCERSLSNCYLGTKVTC